jgi:hypothetical protein
LRDTPALTFLLTMFQLIALPPATEIVIASSFLTALDTRAKRGLSTRQNQPENYYA